MSTGMQATWYIPRPFKIIPSYWLILGGLSRAKCTCKTIHKKESLISVSTSFNTLVLFYLDQEIHQISKLRILVYFSTASRSLFSLPSSFLLINLIKQIPLCETRNQIFLLYSQCLHLASVFIN